MFVALAAEAQNNLSFKTEELKKVAAELKLEGLDTLKIGYTFIQKNNHQLVVRKAENGMVEHIGIQLFPEAYRQQANGAVLDFLENGLLCNTYKLTKNQLKYMDAKFVKGNWSLMLSLPKSVSCSVAMVNNKAYQIIWKDGKTRKLIFFFRLSMIS